MSRYQAYAEYKDSGVEWLGEIPCHWEVLQSRRMFAVRSEAAWPDDKMLTASQKYGVLYQADFVELEGRRVVEVILGVANLRHVEPNDFIISMRSFQGGIEWCTLRGSTSFHYVMLKPLKYVVPQYFAHALKSTPYIHALRKTSDLIRDGQELRFSNFAQVPLPVIPADEQIAIANFLDHETAKIDLLIEKQQALIELLKEKRQAVISHAVTKGLNPNAPMKDSGVEWLGEVPEHWKTGNLRWFIDIASGDGLSATEIESEQDQSFQFKVIGGNGTMGYTAKINTSSQAFAIGRVGALCGNVHLINEPCWITDNALRISRWNEFESSYLYFLLLAARLNEYANKSAQPLITGEQVKSLVVTIPPDEEQTQIGKYIESELKKFDDLMSSCKSAIALMQERRTALISAAVTGKIDVRDWQAPSNECITM